MFEEIAVFVPVGGIGCGGAPGLIGAISEVDDEGVGPLEGFDRGEVDGLHAVNCGVNTVLATEDIADGAPGVRTEVF